MLGKDSNCTLQRSWLFQSVLVSSCGKGIWVIVHGEDFAAVGRRSHLEWFALELGKHMMVKDKGTLGPDQGSVTSLPTGGKAADLREIKLLNRTIRWINAGVDAGGERLEWEADLRHAQLMAPSLAPAGAS